MMKLEEQVANIEPAKEMKDLGSKQDAHFSYFQVDEWNVVLRETREMFNPNSYSTINKDTFICSAPTVAELGEMLPEEYNTAYLLNDKEEKNWGAYKNRMYQTNPSVKAETEADARAKMWIWLKKEGLI